MSIVPIQAVVFDLDGTLIDTERFYRAAFHATARAFGVALPPGFYPALVGIATSERRPILRRAFGPSFPVDDFIAAYYVQRAAHLPTRLPLCPGASRLLQALRVPKAIATSASRRTTLAHLDRAGLHGHFLHVVTRDEVRHGKPAPDTYLTAAGLLGVAPTECLAVEDSLNGAAAAHAAGMRVAMVTTDVESGSEVPCFTVVSRLDALADLISPTSARNRAQRSYVVWAGEKGARPVTHGR